MANLLDNFCRGILRPFLDELGFRSQSNETGHDRQCRATGKSLSEALLFAKHGENMLCTKFVLNVRNNSVHKMFFQVLSLEFSWI